MSTPGCCLGAPVPRLGLAAWAPRAQKALGNAKWSDVAWVHSHSHRPRCRVTHDTKAPARRGGVEVGRQPRPDQPCDWEELHQPPGGGIFLQLVHRTENA